MGDKNVAIRKRQQIENASKTMFMWVAIAAAIVGLAVVLAVSLFERITFNQTIINEKNQTVDRLRKNNLVVEDLKKNVRVLNTNEALISTDRLEGTEPVAVILDALPSNPNSSALGASLQQKLFNVDGVSVDSLTVNPISGIEDSGDQASSDEETGENQISFNFVVSTASSKADNLKKVLKNLERSVRVIDLSSLSIEQQNDKITLSGEGNAFYQPETKVELKQKAKRP